MVGTDNHPLQVMAHVFGIPHSGLGRLTQVIPQRQQPKPVNQFRMFSPAAQRLFQSPNVQPLLQTGQQVRYQVNPQTRQISYSGQSIPTLGVSSSPAGGSTTPSLPTQPTPTQPQLPSAPQELFETAPAIPSFEEQYGGLFDQALSALDAQLEVRKQESQVDILGIEQKAERQKADIKGQLATTEQQFQTQEQRETQREEEAASEIRRQFSEMQQGFQARFGRTTGTGRAASEILGREVMRIMSQNRQATQNTLNDIFLAKASTISEANRRLFDTDQQAEQLKREAQVQLNRDRADILYKRGQLAIDRNKQLLDVYKNYQEVITSINQRNTAFKQKLFQDQQEFDKKLQLKKFDVINDYSTDLTSRITSFIKSGVLTEQGLRQAEKSLGLVPTSLQLPKRQAADDEDEEEKRKKRLRKIAGVE